MGYLVIGWRRTRYLGRGLGFWFEEGIVGLNLRLGFGRKFIFG